MPSDFRRRADILEEMDRPDCAEDRLFRTLDQFRLVNLLFSRYRALLEHCVLAPMRKAPLNPYRLVDVGAGGCDIARWLVRRARRQGLRLRVLAIDRDPRVVRYASGRNRDYPEIEVQQMDGLEIHRLAPVDFVFANHLLHHLTDDQIAGFLRRLDGMPVQRYVLSDLIRSRAAAHAFRLAVAPFARQSFLLRDGLRSIQRGFTPTELVGLIQKVNLVHPVRIHRLFPSRFAIIGIGQGPDVQPMGASGA